MAGRCTHADARRARPGEPDSEPGSAAFRSGPLVYGRQRTDGACTASRGSPLRLRTRSGFVRPDPGSQLRARTALRVSPDLPAPPLAPSEDGPQGGPAGPFALAAEAAAEGLRQGICARRPALPAMHRGPAERLRAGGKTGRRPSSKLTGQHTASTSVNAVDERLLVPCGLVAQAVDTGRCTHGAGPVRCIDEATGLRFLEVRCTMHRFD